MAERETDPLTRLRQLLDDGERRANAALSELMAGDGFRDVSGLASRASLAVRKRALEAWGRGWANVNVPTRTDVIRLGKRLAELEQGLARLEAAVSRIERRSEGASEPARRPGPPRTRRPPSERPGRSEPR